MGYSFAISFHLIEPSELPPRLSSWEDVEDIINDSYKKKQIGDSQGYAESTSRNWWHQHLLYLLCRAYKIEGLEFTAQEITCLQKDALFAASLGVDKLFQLVETQNLWNKVDELENYPDTLTMDYLSAYQEAKISSDIYDYGYGYEAMISFFSFLKTLKVMLTKAYQTDKYLLYVMPAFNEFVGGYENL